MSTSKSQSIRRSLSINLLGIVLLLGLAILGVTFLGSRAALQRFSQSLIDQTSARTELELRRFFDPVSRQLRQLQELGSAGRLDLDDPEGLDAALGAFMRQHPWVTSAMLADETGREHMLIREGEGWRSRQIGGPRGAGRALGWEWAESASVRSETEEALDYDPRRRPWFVGAEEGARAEGSPPSLYWTEPYAFFTTRARGSPPPPRSGRRTAGFGSWASTCA